MTLPRRQPRADDRPRLRVIGDAQADAERLRAELLGLPNESLVELARCRRDEQARLYRRRTVPWWFSV